MKRLTLNLIAVLTLIYGAYRLWPRTIDLSQESELSFRLHQQMRYTALRATFKHGRMYWTSSDGQSTGTRRW
jgi:hypothetical protein